MRKALKFAGSLLLGLVWSAVGVSTASADTINFTLDTGNAAIPSATYPGPYISVTVNRTDTTHATLTFASLNSPGVGTYTYAMGANGMVGANINASSFSLTALSEVGGGTPSIANPPGTSNLNGWGTFNAVIDNTDGFTDRATSVTFTVTNLTSTWATASNVLAGNSGGAVAAAHVFVVDGPAAGTVCSGGACSTGYVAGSGPGGGGPPQEVPMPEPGSLLLLGSGLAALAAWSRKKSRP